jgi:hypothetical protein
MARICGAAKEAALQKTAIAQRAIFFAVYEMGNSVVD